MMVANSKEEMLNKEEATFIGLIYVTANSSYFECEWFPVLQKKENGKRRKDDNTSSRKNKDKKVPGTIHVMMFQTERTFLPAL